jgi:RHS repeat-associated protein
LPDGRQVDYVVDADGRRVAKRINGTAIAGFLYDNQSRIVAQLDGTGNVLGRFVYGTKPNVPDYMIRAGQTYRLISDQVGSLRLAVDVATGVVAQRIDFDPFGRVLANTNPGFQPFGFAGGLLDDETGLTRLGKRDYDGATGRWLSKDRALFAGGSTNLYSYAHDDPVNMVDAGGQFAFLGEEITVLEVIDVVEAATQVYHAYHFNTELDHFSKQLELANDAAWAVTEGLNLWAADADNADEDAISSVMEIYQEQVYLAAAKGAELAGTAYRDILMSIGAQVTKMVARKAKSCGGLNAFFGGGSDPVARAASRANWISLVASNLSELCTETH